MDRNAPTAERMASPRRRALTGTPRPTGGQSGSPAPVFHNLWIKVWISPAERSEAAGLLSVYLLKPRSGAGLSSSRAEIATVELLETGKALLPG